MLHKTRGITLRSIKYGDTSLIVTMFTGTFGVQTYMVQGVRSQKSQRNKAAAFQPGTLLELVVYHHPMKNLQRIREFELAYIYSSVQENVIKNTIVLFSGEVLLRLLPEHAPLPPLFDFTWQYFIALDKLPVAHTGNLPLYFVIQCSRELGYELIGSYSPTTPNLNLQEGGFTEHPPVAAPYMSNEEARALGALQAVDSYEALSAIELNGAMRLRLIDWYISFLQQHSQHMGNIKSLPVLRAILHG
jgi:DNA repair protein RecO (recombination protein O)